MLPESGRSTQTWYSCWTSLNTLTLSLGGHTSTLVPDDAIRHLSPAAYEATRVAAPRLAVA